MNKTKIEWCDATINAVRGCTYGCAFCYAKINNDRHLPGSIPDFSRPQFFPERLKQLENKKPKRIFMDSMSDIADWKYEWVDEVMKACYANPQHEYLFLTKRPEQYIDIINYLEGPDAPETKDDNYPGIWLGASAGTRELLRKAFESPATWISIEPICEHLQVDGYFSDSCRPDCVERPRWVWVVIGAETGNRKRKIIPKRGWINEIVEECDFWNIPVFMKDSLIPIVGEENMRREWPEGLRR